MQEEQFGRYVLLHRLGYGGMAEVFLARTGGLGGFEKLLAIKRLLPFCTQDKQTVDLLADEAKLTVRLTHPNIVQVFDFGVVDERYFIAMEYVDGLDLKSLVQLSELESRPPPIDVALFVVTSILDALEFAHKRVDDFGKPINIIHRDVSPHNVLISRHGQVKLTDFGVARAAISSHVSIVGDIRGKFSYMPPEQACGGEIDHRVDIFAAGAILYELLTGKQPFRSTSSGEQMALLRRDVEPPSSLGCELPRELDEIVVTALAKDPARRFDSAATFGDALRAVLDRRYASDMLGPQRQLVRLVEERMREYDDEDGGALREASLPAAAATMMTLGEFEPERESLIAPLFTAEGMLRPLMSTDEVELLSAAADAPTAGDPALMETRLAIVPAQLRARADAAQVLLPGRTDERTLIREAAPRAPTERDLFPLGNQPTLETFPPADVVAARGVAPASEQLSMMLEDTQPVQQMQLAVDRGKLAHEKRRPARRERQVASSAPEHDPQPTDPDPERHDAPPVARRARETDPAARTKLYLTIGALLLVMLVAVALAVWLATSHDEQGWEDDVPTIGGEQRSGAALSAPEPAAVVAVAADASSSEPVVGRSSTEAAPAGRSWRSQAEAERASPGRAIGFLTLRAARRGQIEIDGRAIGRPTPLVGHRLAAGTHRVRIRYRGRRRSVERKIVIRAGQTTLVHFGAH